MKKIKIGLISCAALVLIMCVPCYARSTDDYLKEITEINEQAKNVTIQVNVPEDFDQRVDVYLNKEAHGITAGDGYSITIPVDAGTYAIHVILPKDAMEQYVATAQEALNVRTDTTLIVNVSANPDYGKNSDGQVEEPDSAETNEVYENFELEDEPAVYDYSDGKESGTIHIQAKNYGVFESLTYHLVGKDVYDIVLDMDHDFEAIVTLPVGENYETGTMEYKTCDWVPESLDVTFKWEHKDNIGAFGQYFTIKDSTTVEDTDLIVYMVNSAETTEVDANQINSGRVIEDQIDAEQKHENEQLKKAFPDEFPSETATAETIPTVEITEKESFDFAKAAKIAGAVIIGAAIGVCVYYRKKK